MKEEEVNKIAECVIEKIKEKYVLVEKTFQIHKNEDEFREKKINFINNIISHCALYYKIESRELYSENKANRKIFNILKIVAKLCRELPEKPISYELISEVLRYDNHSSIVYLMSKFDEKYSKNTEFRLEYHEIKEKIQQGLK